jgi:hypothetical protein
MHPQWIRCGSYGRSVASYLPPRMLKIAQGAITLRAIRWNTSLRETFRNRLRRRLLPANCRTLDRRCSHILHVMTISHYFRLLYLMRRRPACSHKPHSSHRVRPVLPSVRCRLWHWDLAAGCTQLDGEHILGLDGQHAKFDKLPLALNEFLAAELSLAAIAALNSRFQMEVAKDFPASVALRCLILCDSVPGSRRNQN